MEREGSTAWCFHVPPSVMRDAVYMLCLKNLPPAQGGNRSSPSSVVFHQQPPSVGLRREKEGGAREKLNEVTDEAGNCLGWCVGGSACDPAVAGRKLISSFAIQYCQQEGFL